MEDHFKNAPRNATYRSKAIQNELIACCGEFITASIVQKIKTAGFFSIIADEATDMSNPEQLALVIRYFDQEAQEIREDFLGFISCDDGVSGEAIATNISLAVTNLGLDISL